MPTRHGVAAATIVTRILPCGLLLRRQMAIRIAEAVARAQIPTVAAWRRMDGARYCTAWGKTGAAALPGVMPN
jgi:hypothetical protein